MQESRVVGASREALLVVMKIVILAGTVSGSAMAGIEQLGLDPYSRGDGIDLKLSGYTGRCYNNDLMEAALLDEDPRLTAAKQAEAHYGQLFTSVRAAEYRMHQAKQAYEDSITKVNAANATAAQVQAGDDQQILLLLAMLTIREANTVALAFFGPSVPPEDAAENFETFLNIISPPVYKYIMTLGNELFGSDYRAFVEAMFYETARLKLLEALNEADKAANDIYEAYVLYNSDEPGAIEVVVADPALLQAYIYFEKEYYALVKTTDLQAEAAAVMAAYNFIDSPSDLPPCDSAEIRAWIESTFCPAPIQEAFKRGDYEPVLGSDAFINEIETRIYNYFKAFFLQATELVCFNPAVWLILNSAAEDSE